MTEIKPSKDIEYVEPTVTVTVYPFRRTPEPESQREAFTSGDFEDALDQVSRPVKGKYADLLPSSEEFIRNKRREVELEDRPS